MGPTWSASLASTAAAVLGLLGGSRLLTRGLAELGTFPPTRAARWAGRITSAVAGIVAVLATHHARSWWLLPALLVWAYTLAAAATCDGLTQRIPTPLVRQGGLVTAALLVVASAVAGEWRWVAHAGVSAFAAGLVLLFCWRFAGAGFGDVRLAILGGLGLVDATRLGLTVAIGTFIVLTLTQATVVLARGGTRHSTFPYGPALAIAFAIAATV